MHIVFELLLLDGHMVQFVVNREKKRTESYHFFLSFFCKIVRQYSSTYIHAIDLIIIG